MSPISQLTIPGLQKFVKALFWAFMALFILNIMAVSFAYLTGHNSMLGILPLFYFDTKYNFPIFFSTFCLLTISLMLYIVYRFHKQNGLRNSTYWLVLCFGFLYIAIDESLNLHGMLTIPLRTLFHTGGFLYYAWVIPAFIICLVLAIYFFPFYRSLPQRHRLLFGLSLILFLGGTVVLELFAARYAPNLGQFDLKVAIVGTIKQTMGWGGELLFLYSLVDYMKLHIQPAALNPRLIQDISRVIRNSENKDMYPKSQ